MKIGELAARAGLNASAIRYYEKVGLLGPATRINGQRRYPVCRRNGLQPERNRALPKGPSVKRSRRLALEEARSSQNRRSRTQRTTLAPPQGPPRAFAPLPLCLTPGLRPPPQPQPQSPLVRCPQTTTALAGKEESAQAGKKEKETFGRLQILRASPRRRTQGLGLIRHPSAMLLTED